MNFYRLVEFEIEEERKSGNVATLTSGIIASVVFNFSQLADYSHFIDEMDRDTQYRIIVASNY